MRRAFVVPRGIAVLAGGTAEPDDTAFTSRAADNDPTSPFAHSDHNTLQLIAKR